MSDRPYDGIPWDSLDADFRQLVEKQLTAQQLRAYRLRQGNMSQRQIAVYMGLALATVRGHLDRADQKIDIALRAREEAAA